MIESIQVKNFKPFTDTGHIDIAPITLLIGPNSSGKSSFLQFISLLSQSVESLDVESSLSTRDKWVDVGSYQDFIYKGKITNNLYFEIAFHDAIYKAMPKEFMQRMMATDGGARTLFSCELSFNKKTTKIYVTSFKFSRLLSTGELFTYYSVVRNQRGKYDLQFEGVGKKPLEVKNVPIQKFYSVDPLSGGPQILSNLFNHNEGRYYVNILMLCNSLIETNLGLINYVGPLRESPVRIHQISGTSPSDVGKRGELAIDLLWAAHRSRTQHMRKGLEAVREWMGELGLATEVELNKITNTNYYRLALKDKVTGHRGTLSDVGFGVSQVLPFLAEIFFAQANSISLVEQPEIHLHPKVQSTLADALISATREGNKRVIIETHSEHIYVRLRRRIAEGIIQPSEVAIYYATPSPEGTKLVRATIDEDGSVGVLPRDFFSDDVEELQAILKAQIRRKNDN